MDCLQTQTYDYIIIGGGISGISFAHKLSLLGKKILILEKEQFTGGQIQTFTTTGNPDFWAEMGAHTCYNSYTNLLTMVTEAGLKNEILLLSKCPYLLATENGIKSIFSQISCLLLSGGFQIIMDIFFLKIIINRVVIN